MVAIIRRFPYFGPKYKPMDSFEHELLRKEEELEFK
jgi:hypothetical protein